MRNSPNKEMSYDQFSKRCQAVIVGGGIVRCSTAYHLSRLGWDVVLLERTKLTSGTTFDAAGLAGQLRSSANITQCLAIRLIFTRRLNRKPGRRRAGR